MVNPNPPFRLVVFSDDWGRHPSSCQHLIRQLLPHCPVLWVNTLGTRSPKLSLEDLSKIFTRLRSWFINLHRSEHSQTSLPLSPQAQANLTITSPRMWPGFSSPWQRRLNARLLTRHLNPLLDHSSHSHLKTICLTTLPITADLPNRLHIDRWIYYCVDDFSVWPGLDGSTLAQMEQQQLPLMHSLIAVSQTLQQRLASLGHPGSHLLTHGIDLSHWQSPPTHPPQTLQSAKSPTPNLNSSSSALPDWCHRLQGPIFLFWGLIDTRLDTAWVKSLIHAQLGTLVLVGPQQSPDPALLSLASQHPQTLLLPGPVHYNLLPTLASRASLLLMPYADLPVTRAMQPLKFKEYLATGKPVIARHLPSITTWADACDLVSSSHDFLSAITQRLASNLPPSQQQARQRLLHESWPHKAEQLKQWMLQSLH